MTELKWFESPYKIDESTHFSCSPSLMKGVCVILTAYDDEEAIGQAVKEFLTQGNVTSVIVIDNNSKDSTAHTAFQAGALVVREYNQGYGFACRRGLVEALFRKDVDIVVLAEGDMTFRGRDIWKLLPFLDDADLVVGSRTHMAFTDLDSQMDWFYLWGNLFIAKILSLRFFNLRFQTRARFTDVGCTMRAIKKSALLKIVDDFKTGGMHFSPHMLKVALKHNLRVVEVPITFRKRVGFSKGAGGNRLLGLRTGIRMICDILGR